MNVIDRHAVVRGAAVGLLVIVPLSIAIAVVERNVVDFDHSGWAPLFAVALLVAYPTAGYVAGRAAPDAPYSNGMVAGMGAFALWIPLRILIWLVRSDHHGLVTGTRPAISAGGIFTQLVLAAALGAFGGWIAGRRSAAAEPTD